MAVATVASVIEDLAVVRLFDTLVPVRGLDLHVDDTLEVDIVDPTTTIISCGFGRLPDLMVGPFEVVQQHGQLLCLRDPSGQTWPLLLPTPRPPMRRALLLLWTEPRSGLQVAPPPEQLEFPAFSGA